jgi:azurin
MAILVATGSSAKPADADTITIAAYDTMNYSLKKIEVRPGQKLIIVLKNEGTIPKNAMAHNWILLKADANVDAYAKAALISNDFQPKALATEVIAAVPATGGLGPNESASTSFTAPTVPGTYHYLCTAVGHTMGGSGMRGVLIVK